MVEPIKLGVVGLSRGADYAVLLHRCAPRLFTVTAVCDYYPSKVKATLDALNLPAAAGYPDHQAMLAKADLEAVLVETGTDTMVQVCCDALSAGKHVCADVPMAETRQQCWDLVVAVEKTGLVYCMGEQVRFANFTIHWRDLIKSGAIGTPLFVQGEYIHPEILFYYERVDTGIPDYESLESVAHNPQYKKTWRNHFRNPIVYIPHELSPLLKILDDRVVSVSCLTADTRMYGDAVEMLDFQCALMHTAKGSDIRIANSFVAPRVGGWFHHWYHIMGTDGMLECARPGWGQDGEIIVHKDGTIERTQYGWAPETYPFGDAEALHAGLESYVCQEYYNAIRHQAPNELNIYTAMESVLPGIIAAESAARGGQMLEVPDVRPSATRPHGSYPTGAEGA